MTQLCLTTYHFLVIPCVLISRTLIRSRRHASVSFSVQTPSIRSYPTRFAMTTAGNRVGEQRANIRLGIPGFEVESCSTTPWSDTCQRESVGLQRQGSKRSNGGIRGSRAPWIAEGADHRGWESVKRASLPDKSAKGARWTPLFTTTGTSSHTCSLQQIWTVL